MPSHFYPIHGKEKIRDGVTRMRDAVLYVHDAVVQGMNEDKDVYTLMREIRLPSELQIWEGIVGCSVYLGGIYGLVPDEIGHRRDQLRVQERTAHGLH